MAQCGYIIPFWSLCQIRKAIFTVAAYTKRGNSYRIRASVGYTVEGKQVMKSKTWTPTPGMTERQIEKELNRQ